MFSKIRQTILSLKSNPPKYTLQDEIDEYGNKINNLSSGETPNRAVRIGVIFAFIVPTVFIIENLFTHSILSSFGTVGTSLLCLGGYYLISKFSDKIIKFLPFYKLNDYFGNKIEETIASLKGK